MREPWWRLLSGRQMPALILLGFASGLPFQLVGDTLKAFAKTAGQDLTTIGFYSAVAVPYALKFLWAPLIDRFDLPLFGRRRGWAILMQAAIALGLVSIAMIDPAQSPWLLAVLALGVAIGGATQDIVVDGWRADVLRREQVGFGTAIFVGAYRIAWITAGAVALYIADQWSWQIAYLVMAAAMGIGVVGSLLCPTPPEPERLPISVTNIFATPFSTFFRRHGQTSLALLAFVMTYKLSDAIANSMATPFLMELGFTLTSIGTLRTGVGMVSAIVAGLLGGALIAAIGLNRSLWIFGALQALSNLVYLILIQVGPEKGWLAAAVVIENACGGLATAAFLGFLLTLCDRRFSATQYALLTALMRLADPLFGSLAGWVATTLGWSGFFWASLAAGLPGMALLFVVAPWRRSATEPTEATPPP